MASSSSSFFPSSSSSPTMTNKISQFRATLFEKTSSLKAASLASRQKTVFRKAEELSILCGIEVCVIHYGSDGELKTWPEDREKVKDMALRYSQLSEEKRDVKQYDLETFLEKINKDDSKRKKKNKKSKKVKLGSSYKYPDWDPRFDNYSEEQLTELIDSLERKQPLMQDRLRAVVESQRQQRSTMRYMNMANQEERQMNQAQSLAPLPTVYQYPNMDMYCSRLLGGQDTGVYEFLSTNMLPYNSFNSNCVNMFSNQFNQNCSKVEADCSVFPQGCGINSMNVEDYSGSLWAQGLQNMDMCGYNNGFSHQLVQFPAQRAAPVCQYMDGSTQNIRPHYEI